MKLYIALFFLLSYISMSEILVCPDCPEKSLVNAINNAEANETVIIDGGTHTVETIEITRPIKLIAKNQAQVISRSGKQIFVIKSDDVLIKGLILKGVKTSYIEDRASIKVIKSSNVVIEGNTILNSFFGIYLAHSKNIIIRDNTVEGNAKVEMSSGNAIHLWYCKKILIENNISTGHRDGIYLEFVDHSLIKNNISKDNLRYGLHFMFSDHDSYIGNTFENNGAGVAVMFSNKITMKNNKFLRNWGANSYGLLLKEIKDSNIENNLFYKNTIGIYSESTMRSSIMHNDFQNNGWALKIISSSGDNIISYNNFISNTFEVAANKNSRSNNLYEYNFWTNYTGYDLDRDGIGDVPHRPIELFSQIVSDSPVAMILLRSSFVEMINFAEKIVPMLTPTNLEDRKPMMEEVTHD